MSILTVTNNESSESSESKVNKQNQVLTDTEMLIP